MKPQWSSNFPALANLLRPERNREAMGRRWADGWRCRGRCGRGDGDLRAAQASTVGPW